jgi:26S proteasome regulatory subunit N5
MELTPYPFEGMSSFTTHGCLQYCGADLILKEYYQTLLHKRIIERNLRVVSLYYKRITIARLASMLSLEHDVLEVHLSEMADDGDIYVKIDRPAGIIR